MNFVKHPTTAFKYYNGKSIIYSLLQISKASVFGQGSIVGRLIFNPTINHICQKTQLNLIFNPYIFPNLKVKLG